MYKNWITYMYINVKTRVNADKYMQFSRANLTSLYTRLVYMLENKAVLFSSAWLAAQWNVHYGFTHSKAKFLGLNGKPYFV